MRRCGYPSEISAWGGLHGDAMLVQGGGAKPSPHLSEPAPGQALHFPIGNGREWVENGWVHPGKLALKTKLEN